MNICSVVVVRCKFLQSVKAIMNPCWLLPNKVIFLSNVIYAIQILNYPKLLCSRPDRTIRSDQGSKFFFLIRMIHQITKWLLNHLSNKKMSIPKIGTPKCCLILKAKKCLDAFQITLRNQYHQIFISFCVHCFQWWTYVIFFIKV